VLSDGNIGRVGRLARLLSWDGYRGTRPSGRDHSASKPSRAKAVLRRRNKIARASRRANRRSR